MPRQLSILVINPGSTSTKIALFRNDRQLCAHTALHGADQLRAFGHVMEQEGLRLNEVRKFVAEKGRLLGHDEAEGAVPDEGLPPERKPGGGFPRGGSPPRVIDAVVGRGGLLRPVEGGVYEVDRAMLEDLRSCVYGEHASNLGAVLAYRIGDEQGCPAYIVDPVVVDEMDPEARLSGMPELDRKSIFHALNQKSAAREVASRLGKKYEDCTFIVAHVGGGISVGAHRRGRVVDVNNALDGEGPFSPERSGGVPAGQLVRLCFSGRFSEGEVLRKITGEGGMVAYCGTNNLGELEDRMAEGDREAGLVFEAMCRQIGQEICKHGATLEGQVDRIILTGGMARSPGLVDRIRRRVGHLAPVEVIPGEREMVSLARGAYQVLRGAWKPKRYGSPH